MTSSVYVFGNGVQEGLIKSFHSIFKKCLDLYMGSLSVYIYNYNYIYICTLKEFMASCSCFTVS